MEPRVLSRPAVAAAIAAGVLIAAVLALPIARYVRRPAPRPAPPVRLSFAAPPGSELGTGDEPLDAAISPDGARVAFVVTTGGITRLWQRSLDAEQADMVRGTEGAQLPAWKPTGRVIAFFAANRLRQVSLPDGAIRDLADAQGPAGVTWLPDGSLLFAASRGPIHHLRNGVLSDATKLRDGDRAHAFPMATGSGDAFVYLATRENGRRVIRLVEGGQEHELTEAASHGQMVGSRLLYVRDNVLFSHDVDPNTRTLTGTTVTLETNVGITSTGRGLFTASPRLLLASPAATRARQLAWLDEHGTRVSSSGEPGDYWQVRLSPDDQYAAVTQLAPLLHTLDVWVHPVAKDGVAEQITLSVAADSDPVWSDDGTRLLFRSLQGGSPNLFTHVVRDPEAKDELFLKSEMDETPTDWRDATVLFQAPRPGSALDIWRFDSEEKSVEGVATTAFNESDARWSPAGDWVAYVSDESGRPDIYAQPWPDGDRVRVSLGGGSRPRWGPDGAGLYFIRGDSLMRADLQNNDQMPFATPRPMFDVPGLRDYDVAHRSNRFLVLLPVMGTGGASVTATMDWEGGPPQ